MNQWTKSSFSEGRNPNCIECRTETGRVLLRDSKQPTRGHLDIPQAEWRAFLTAIRHGEL